MPNRQFYSKLSVSENLQEAFNLAQTTPIPRDWHILIVQAQNVTEATIAKKYHHINLLISSAILSVSNIDKNLEIPSIFQGDSALILIPDHIHFESRDNLVQIKQMARIKFGIRLNIGSVPVQNIYNDNYRLGIAKVRINLESNLVQPLLSGGGLSYAIELLNQHPHAYQIQEYALEDANQPALENLDSTWQHLPIPNRETLSITINVRHTDSPLNFILYKQVLNRIERVVESTDFWSKNNAFLVPNLNREAIETITQVKLQGKSSFTQSLMIPWRQLQSALNIPSFLPGKNIISQAFKHNHFNNIQFSEGLSMVLTATPLQKIKITNSLDQLYKIGKIYYGIHSSPTALISSLKNYNRDNIIHYVDGSDGGLSFAKQHLNQQIKESAAFTQDTYAELH